MSMYHLAADISKRVEGGESLKNILYGVEHGKYTNNIPAIRSLVDITLRNRVTIDNIIDETKLSEEIVFSELWTARVLVAELVFGKKSYHCTDEFSKKVYKYKEDLKAIAINLKRKDRVFIPRYCRINAMKCTVKHFHDGLVSAGFKLKEVGGKSEITYQEFLKLIRNMKKIEYIQDYHLADLFIFHNKANLVSLDLYKEYQIILQDKASCLVAPLLAPTPGSLMLDMCAAPGFKTQHLSSISATSGLILAVDISKDRYNILTHTRNNYDLKNVMTFNADALHLPEMATKCIEYILLDAPCSGSGVVSNYDYGTENRSYKERLTSLHNLQAYLLRTALTKYTSARRIVYSTCSINEEENESVVEEVLKFAVENQFILVNLQNHLQDFAVGSDKYSCGKSCIKLLPEQSCTNGFFIALFERSNPPNPRPRTEFYKSLNEIIAAIHSKKKRKIDEEGKNNNIDENNEKRNIISSELNNICKGMDFKSPSKSPKISGDEKLVNEEVKAKKLKLSDSSLDHVKSGESSTDDENTVEPTLDKRLPEKSLIRVLQSPLLKNPINKERGEEEKVDSEDDDSSEEENEKTQSWGIETAKTFKPIVVPEKQSTDSSSSDTESDEEKVETTQECNDPNRQKNFNQDDTPANQTTVDNTPDWKKPFNGDRRSLGRYTFDKIENHRRLSTSGGDGKFDHQPTQNSNFRDYRDGMDKHRNQGRGGNFQGGRGGRGYGRRGWTPRNRGPRGDRRGSR